MSSERHDGESYDRAGREYSSSVQEMQEQIRLLQEEARSLQEEARSQRAEERVEREREREERERERERERQERRMEKESLREQLRVERESTRGNRRGRAGFSGTPPMPPLPPMPPPLPPIPGAGGTFTPFDFMGLGSLFGTPPPPPKRSRGRAGRGDVRIAVLLLLDESPANGYQLMQEIEQRTGGAWKPSSGSIYPALQQLEDEGIVTTTEGEGRKMFALTDDGRAYVADRRDDWTPPWENVEEGEEPTEEAVRIRDLIAQLGMAYMQVIQVGTESQRSEAARVLTGARQALYRILAGDTSDE